MTVWERESENGTEFSPVNREGRLSKSTHLFHIKLSKIYTHASVCICNSFHLFFNKFILFILFLSALGLCCSSWAFSSCSERGLLFVAVHGLLIAVASLVAEHGL